MVALDNQAFFGQRVPHFKLTLGPLVGGIGLGSALLVLGAILMRGFAENGFRLGSQLAWRYASFIFFLALIGGPLCRIAARLFPRRSPPDSLSRRLVWGFCISYGIYLLSVFIPNVIQPSAGAALMVMFGGGVVLVMAVTAAPLARLGRPPVLPNNIRRVLLGTAARFFPGLQVPESLSRKLVWGFCLSYGIYLLSVFVPNVIRPSAGAALMVLFGGAVVLVMAVTAAPLARLGRAPIIANKIRRVLLGLSAIYFWLCYSLMALARIAGPHRPDDYYGLSLCLMVVGLLARYADRWLVPKEQAIKDAITV